MTAEWSGAPTPQAIAEADAERLLGAHFLSLPPSENENIQALTARLVAEHTPEQLATALVGMWRKSLPEPAQLRVITPDATRTRGPRDENAPPREPRERRGFRPAPAPRDPFFDKPYEPSSAETPPVWESQRPATRPGVSANIKTKRKVAALFKPGE